jgi:hypothetical protein
MRILALAAAAAALCLAGTAAAQDFDAAPNYGDITLAPGFQPDPHLVSLRAGGDIAVSNTLPNCSGYITSAPDYRLYWNGSGSLDLIVAAISNSDTTLVVNGPNGEWYCDDDSGDGTNPRIQLASVAGRYEIWIGTYASGETQTAVLGISELSSF